MQRNKLLLVFPDGVGIRNYLYSNTIDDNENDLVLFHNFDASTIADLKKHKNLSSNILIPAYSESLKEKFIRELICFCRLHYNAKKMNNITLLTNWKRAGNAFSKRLFYTAVQISRTFNKNYSDILKLEEKYENAIRKNVFYDQVKSILEQEKPQRIFCSHQRGLKVATIFAAAKDLGIPTTTVIYSWDNLPKARLMLRADYYNVWSDYMKNEMALYYPEIPLENVIVTGTPQFEFYSDPQNIIPKTHFFNTYRLDPTKKIICYSGDDEMTSPDDPKYLYDVASEITKAGLDTQYQILFRRSPVDLTGRFNAIVEAFPDLIREAPPIWHSNSNENWTTIYPDLEDVKLLVSTAFYSDVVVNLGSTMAFDFGMFDKPCIFINYDQNDKVDANWSVKTIYNFQHFKSMPDKNAVVWLNAKEEIADKIVNANTYRNNNAMKDWFRTIVTPKI